MNLVSSKKKVISALFCALMMSCVVTPQVIARGGNSERIKRAEQFSSIIGFAQVVASLANGARRFYTNGDRFEKVMACVAGVTAATFLTVTCIYCSKLLISEVKNYIKDIKEL